MNVHTTPLSGFAAIKLIAGREIKQRAATKSMIWTTAILVALIIVGSFIGKLVMGSDPTLTIGVTDQTAAVAASVKATAEGLGTPAEISTVTEAEGRSQVLDGDLDALIIDTTDGLSVVTKSELSTSLSSVFTIVAQQNTLAAEISKLGGDSANVAAKIASAKVSVEAIEPPRTVDSSQVIAGMLVGILLFITLQLSGQIIAQGVVEEKTSRVVELLLATVRPWQLMAGKVLGIGTIGLTQMLLFVGAAAGSATVFGLVDGVNVSLGPIVFWSIAWFLVGFIMFALLFAAAGALVSRQEEVGTVTAPILMIMMVPYFVAVTVAPSSPDSPLVQWLSYLPFTAPLMMPSRVALGGVETWQVALAFAVNLALIPVLVWFAGRIYSNAVLRTGARIKLKDALHAS